jgi:hypothetical protein
LNRTFLAACAAVLLALLAATPAGASKRTYHLHAADSATQTPFPLGALYGGGRLGFGKIDDPSDQLVAIRVSQDRAQLNIVNVLNVDCADGGFAHRAPIAYNVPLSADGSFSGSIPYHDHGPGGHEDGTFSYQGKFNGTDPAKGTSRLQFTVTLNGGGGTTCDTNAVKWEVRDPSSKPGSGRLKKKGAYYGVRSDTRQIEFRVGKSGKSIVDLYFTVFFDSGQCSAGYPALGQIGTGVPFKIKKGRFKKSGSIQLFLDPGAPTYKWKLQGKFGKRRVSGTLQYTADLHDSSGNVTSHCASPKLPATLERG